MMCWDSCRSLRISGAVAFLMFGFTTVSFIVTSLIPNKICTLSEAFTFCFLSVASRANG